MALHTGEVGAESARNGGVTLDHAARILGAAHPGQILCSETTAAILRAAVEPGETSVQFVDLGVFRLGGVASDASPRDRLFQAVYPSMPRTGFPPPKAPPAHTGRLPLQL